MSGKRAREHVREIRGSRGANAAVISRGGGVGTAGGGNIVDRGGSGVAAVSEGGPMACATDSDSAVPELPAEQRALLDRIMEQQRGIDVRLESVERQLEHLVASQVVDKA